MDDAAVVVSLGLSSELESTLFFISGYLQHKFDLPAPAVSTDSAPESEFTSLLSRGRLKYPSENLFQFVRLCYTYFDIVYSPVQRLRCVTYFRKLLSFLYSSTPFEICAPIDRLCHCIVNCFFKGVTKIEHAPMQVPAGSQRKLRKLTDAGPSSRS